MVEQPHCSFPSASSSVRVRRSLLLVVWLLLPLCAQAQVLLRGVVRDAETGVTLVMDAALRRAEVVHLHPLVNDRTVAMTPGDLERVLSGWGAEIRWLELG